MQFLRLVTERILLSLLTLLLVSLIIFFVLEILPGDVASRILGRDATPESLDNLREKLGLYDPAVLRYWHWLSHFVTGNFGQSLVSSRPVTEILAPRIFNTVVLSVYAFLLYLPLTVLPAIVQAIRRDKPSDHALSVVTLVLLSMPDFLLATILLFLFVVVFRWFPAIATFKPEQSFAQHLYATFLPTVALAMLPLAESARFVRTEMIEALQSDYATVARAKGFGPWQIAWRHGLRNSVIPLLTALGPMAVALVTGSLVIENIFAVPGIGEQFVTSVLQNDYPTIMAITIFYSALLLAVLLLIDVLYMLVDPRIRVAGSGR